MEHRRVTHAELTFDSLAHFVLELGHPVPLLVAARAVAPKGLEGKQ